MRPEEVDTAACHKGRNYEITTYYGWKVIRDPVRKQTEHTFDRVSSTLQGIRL